jgi:BioD-like phosphotransacetylase family protein
MKPLLVTSNQPFSGKSSFCVGIGKLMIERGYRMGYMKPLITLPVNSGGKVIDEDAQHISALFGQCDSLDNISPVNYIELLNKKIFHDALNLQQNSYINKIKDSFNQIAKNKDIVLIESGRSIEDGLHLGVSSREICAALGAKALVIAKYTEELLDQLLYYKEFFKDSFGGVIINRVPKEDFDYIENIVIKYLEKAKINVFGYVTSDRVLSSVSIREMSKYLGGKILSAADRQDELVESFMLGAMGQELALKFFRTKTDKAVITGGDRADVQLAALETNTRCLILTGNFSPSSIVVERAEHLGVPIVLVKYDTLTTVEKLNEILGHSGFHEFKKLDKIMQITRDFINLDAILSVVKN